MIADKQYKHIVRDNAANIAGAAMTDLALIGTSYLYMPMVAAIEAAKRYAGYADKNVGKHEIAKKELIQGLQWTGMSLFAPFVIVGMMIENRDCFTATEIRQARHRIDEYKIKQQQSHSR